MIATATQEFGTFDIVCPGAGIFEPPWSNFWQPPGTALSKDAVDDGRYATLDINVTHPIRSTQLAIAAFLRAQKESASSVRTPKRVLIISSVAGQTCNLHTPIYTAAKHAERLIPLTLRQELVGRPVRIIEVAPGMVATEEFSLNRFGGDAERAASVYAGVPEPLVADDVADVISWTLTRPSHVNVDLVVVRPRAQATSTLVAREAAE